MKTLREWAEEKRRERRRLATEKKQTVLYLLVKHIADRLSQTFTVDFTAKFWDFSLKLVSLLRDIRDKLKGIVVVRFSKGTWRRFGFLFNELFSFLQNTTFKVRAKRLEQRVEKVAEAISSLKDTISAGNEASLNTTDRVLGKAVEELQVISTQLEELRAKIKPPVVNLDTKDTTKAVKELKKPLTEVVKSLSSLKVFFAKLKSPDVVRVSNLDEVGKKVTELGGAIKNLSFPETDLTPVVKAVKKVETSIKSLKFPIPSFTSSYEHSLAMKMRDANKTYTYDANGNLTQIDATYNGETYRKTFTYDANGNITSISKWTKVS